MYGFMNPLKSVNWYGNKINLGFCKTFIRACTNIIDIEKTAGKLKIYTTLIRNYKS